MKPEESAGDLCLDITGSPPRATFTQGQSTVTVGGSPAQRLAIYAFARVEEPWPEGGWLTTAEAMERWQAPGGKADSVPERIAWDRGKVRSALVREGAIHPAVLFERRRQGAHWLVRLGLSPDCVRIVEPG